MAVSPVKMKARFTQWCLVTMLGGEVDGVAGRCPGDEAWAGGHDAVGELIGLQGAETVKEDGQLGRAGARLAGLHVQVPVRRRRNSVVLSTHDARQATALRMASAGPGWCSVIRSVVARAWLTVWHRQVRAQHWKCVRLVPLDRGIDRPRHAWRPGWTVRH